MKKHWYDYLWIVELTYLVLGFFNILFAWIGLLFFFIPLIIALPGEQRVTATATAAVGRCLACWEGDLAFLGKRIFQSG